LDVLPSLPAGEGCLDAGEALPAGEGCLCMGEGLRPASEATLPVTVARGGLSSFLRSGYSSFHTLKRFAGFLLLLLPDAPDFESAEPGRELG